MVTKFLAELLEEVQCFILRMAAIFVARKEQLIFLINNYDLALNILTVSNYYYYFFFSYGFIPPACIKSLFCAKFLGTYSKQLQRGGHVQNVVGRAKRGVRGGNFVASFWRHGTVR